MQLLATATVIFFKILSYVNFKKHSKFFELGHRFFVHFKFC